MYTCIVKFASEKENGEICLLDSNGKYSLNRTVVKVVEQLRKEHGSSLQYTLEYKETNEHL